MERVKLYRNIVSGLLLTMFIILFGISIYNLVYLFGEYRYVSQKVYFIILFGIVPILTILFILLDSHIRRHDRIRYEEHANNRFYTK